MTHRSPHSSVPEPEWGEWRSQRLREIPSGVQTWLRDSGSLTRKVIQACSHGHFRVRLLHQGWGRPLNSERKVMKTRRGVITLVREVELLCDEQPWVFARTLIPATSLQRSVRRLTQLGEKPLGAVLFSDPKVHRGVTQIARLQPKHPLFDAACIHIDDRPEMLWARRTMFYLAGRPLLVNEIFLPDIPLKDKRV
ncbi:MAG: chorismate lyase [Candidatus Thiodiazotropha sp. (ex Semelilucina semeliformis)]|nr:chorismate lyase [Candidatus Thiodiazotropha sp. (ex Semelilucina semeliformis)]MCU7828117.1 chorismate lyase [Candidatus Thiodiazotropha sp. (ex Myrtea sp. 'scaly one' KF741663)]